MWQWWWGGRADSGLPSKPTPFLLTASRAPGPSSPGALASLGSPQPTCPTHQHCRPLCPSRLPQPSQPGASARLPPRPGMPLADRPPPPGQPPPFTCGLMRHGRCRAARSTRTRLLPPAPMGTRPHPSSPDRPPAVLRSSTKEMEQLGSGRLSPFQNGSFFAPVQSKADPSFRATRGPRTQAHNLRV